jgi:hypothetical protein
MAPHARGTAHSGRTSSGKSVCPVSHLKRSGFSMSMMSWNCISSSCWSAPRLLRACTRGRRASADGGPGACASACAHPISEHQIHLQPAALLAAVEQPPAQRVVGLEDVRLGWRLLIPATRRNHGEAWRWRGGHDRPLHGDHSRALRRESPREHGCTALIDGHFQVFQEAGASWRPRLQDLEEPPPPLQLRSPRQ